MAEGKKPRFKLQSERVDIPIAKVRATTLSIFEAHGCGPDEAAEVTDHLINADQSGVESHGVVRALQYAREYRNGVLIPGAPIEIIEDNDNRLRLDAGSGIGIRAMRKAVEAATERAQRHGLAMVTLTGAGHTGRLGAFAEEAANADCMTITLGGGDRKRWRRDPSEGRAHRLRPGRHC